MIIGINGKIGHGKDTVGSIIQYLTSESYARGRSFDQFLRGSSDAFGDMYHSEWEIKKYAYKLKAIVALLTGIDQKRLEDNEVKNSFLPSNWNKNGAPITVRQALQWVGTEAMRNGFHTDVWVNSLFADYKQVGYSPNIYQEYPNWIITDMRFPNELEAVKDHGGITVRVTRDNVPTSDHPSETSLDGAKFDYRIENNGTIDDLIHKVKLMLNAFRIRIHEPEQVRVTD